VNTSAQITTAQELWSRTRLLAAKFRDLYIDAARLVQHIEKAQGIEGIDGVWDRPARRLAGRLNELAGIKVTDEDRIFPDDVKSFAAALSGLGAALGQGGADLQVPRVNDFWFEQMRERGDGEREYVYLEQYAPPSRNDMRWGMRFRYVGPKVPKLNDDGTLAQS
jgi:hypothetical protein